MPYFLCRLLPPRPSFPADMTEEEKALMARHGAFWRQQAEQGVAIAVGPVMDPAGAWGVAIAETGTMDAMRSIVAADPVVVADLGFSYDLHPMPSLILRVAPQSVCAAT